MSSVEMAPALATALRLAVPVVSRAVTGLPLSPLDDLSRPELVALVSVLAENADPVKLLTAARTAGPVSVPDAAEDAHARLRHRSGPLSRWELPDDGLVDDVAVDLVARGERDVPLSHRERVTAAQLIRARGGNLSLISSRLHVSFGAAALLLAELETPARAGAATGDELAEAS